MLGQRNSGTAGRKERGVVVKSGMLTKMRAKQEQELRFSRLFTMQQCEDMMLIALNEAFGFGADRLKKFGETYHEVFVEYARKTEEDAKNDKQIDYTKGIVDRKLKQICGEFFCPWEERYRF